MRGGLSGILGNGVGMVKVKKVVAVVLCVSLLAGSNVQAAGISRKAEDYSAVFDADFYYNNYPDVQETVGYDAEALQEHFVNLGMKEGRIGKSVFNVRAYMKNNLDLVSLYGIKDLSVYYYHYIQTGKEEGRKAVGPSGGEGEIASFSTAYNVEEDRAVNVKLAASRINGTVLEPGEEFSFSKSIMSRTLANGYVVAPSFASGKVVSSVGGGICQVSSTLYVVMMLSSIPATERYAHSLHVDYVPEGLDSAIVEGVKDLCFKNPYDYSIRIDASAEDGILTVGISEAEDKAF